MGTEIGPTLPNEELGVVESEVQMPVALWDPEAQAYKVIEVGAEAVALEVGAEIAPEPLEAIIAAPESAPWPPPSSKNKKKSHW